MIDDDVFERMTAREGLDDRVPVNEELYLERSIERVTMSAS